MVGGRGAEQPDGARSAFERYGWSQEDLTTVSVWLQFCAVLAIWVS